MLYFSFQICCVDNYENIQKFCRLRETRSVFYASCNHSIITFRTDGSGTRRGFQLSYTFQRGKKSVQPLNADSCAILLNYNYLNCQFESNKSHLAPTVKTAHDFQFLLA